MSDGQIGQVLLRFDAGQDQEMVRRELSAIAFDTDGNLWLAPDEDTRVSRLELGTSGELGCHRQFDLSAALRLPDPQEEMDIEGLDWQDGRLWLVGSHTSTRKSVDLGSPAGGGLKRPAKVRRRLNRFVIGCVMVQDGELNSGPRPRRLPITKKGNALAKALRSDPHLGPFLQVPAGKRGAPDVQLASKENGFDVEGLAGHGERLFLGLRGPVLRGWALLLEIEPEKAGRGELGLKKIGAGGRPYRKHFVDLDGMGIRDLVPWGDDLLLLAGPTMDITGLQSVYRLRDAAGLRDDSLTGREGSALELLFHLPITHGCDKAEGMAHYDGFGEPGLLLVYDSPCADRLVGGDGVLADVYRLPAG